MAFGFLKDVGDIVTGVSGIASLFGGPGSPAGSDQMQYALEEAIKLAKASAQPGSKQFKNLVKLEEEANRIAAVENIQRYLRQNQRAIARGDISGVVNPERRDESVMRALGRAFQDAELMAREKASGTLRAAAGALTGAASAAAPIVSVQNQLGMGEAKRRADLGQAVGAGLSSLAPILEDYLGPGSGGGPAPSRTGSPLAFSTRTVLT